MFLVEFQKPTLQVGVGLPLHGREAVGGTSTGAYILLLHKQLTFLGFRRTMLGSFVPCLFLETFRYP